MQVSISASTIQNVLNADVIHLDRLQSMTADDKTKAAESLATTLEQAVAALPAQVGAEDREALVRESKALAADVRKKGLADPTVRETRIKRFFETLRACFGDTAEIVKTAVKLVQVITS